IRRHMPDDLTGKTVITQTITKKDVDELKRRGVRLLVTSTPELNGRSFATNVIEALLIAVSGRDREPAPEEYVALNDELDLRPRIDRLNDWACAAGAADGAAVALRGGRWYTPRVHCFVHKPTARQAAAAGTARRRPDSGRVYFGTS